MIEYIIYTYTYIKGTKYVLKLKIIRYCYETNNIILCYFANIILFRHFFDL